MGVGYGAAERGRKGPTKKGSQERSHIGFRFEKRGRIRRVGREFEPTAPHRTAPPYRTDDLDKQPTRISLLYLNSCRGVLGSAQVCTLTRVRLIIDATEFAMRYGNKTATAPK